MKEVGNFVTFGIGNVVHQCHVLGYVSLMFEDPDDNKRHIVSLGFSTGKNRPNTAGVQFRSISEEDKETDITWNTFRLSGTYVKHFGDQVWYCC